MAKVTITIEDIPGPPGAINVQIVSDPPITSETSVEEMTAAQDAGGMMIYLYDSWQNCVEQQETRSLVELQEAGESIFIGSNKEKKCFEH